MCAPYTTNILDLFTDREENMRKLKMTNDKMEIEVGLLNNKLFTCQTNLIELHQSYQKLTNEVIELTATCEKNQVKVNQLKEKQFCDDLIEIVGPEKSAGTSQSIPGKHHDCEDKCMRQTSDLSSFEHYIADDVSGHIPYIATVSQFNL